MGSKLNILFVVADQERSRTDLPSGIGLPGHERLYAKGTVFDNFHVPTVLCTPARSVIYSGLHTQATGVIGNTNAPPFREFPADVSIGHTLRSAGYYTAYKGKWHLSNFEAQRPGGIVATANPDALESYGFADFGPDDDSSGRVWEGYMRDRAIASDAATWLFEKGRPLNDAGKPWYLAVNLHNPHDIMWYLASQRQGQSRVHKNLVSPLRPSPVAPPYDKDWDVDLPKSLSDDLSDKPWAHANHREVWKMILGGPAEDDIEAWRNYQSYYFNCIRDADIQLSLILDALEKSGLAEQTIIVFTSDHGEMGGAHGLREKGPMMYKENNRVPLIVCHPDWPGGGETESLASALDIAPTLLRFAGIDDGAKAPDLPGIDLSSALGGNGGYTERDARGILFYHAVVLWAFDAQDVGAFLNRILSVAPGAKLPEPPTDRLAQPIDKRAMLRGIHTGRYKFGRYFAPSEHHVPTDWEMLTGHNDLELYDLDADPDEMKNLAVDAEGHKDLILDLNERLNKAIEIEIGTDDGREYPGAVEQYQLAG